MIMQNEIIANVHHCPAEARQLTSSAQIVSERKKIMGERLAAGDQTPRDLWWTAWATSAV